MEYLHGFAMDASILVQIGECYRVNVPLQQLSMQAVDVPFQTSYIHRPLVWGPYIL